MKWFRNALAAGAVSTMLSAPMLGYQNFMEVKPSPQQVAWQDLEFGVIVHFSTNTFLDREWGFNNPPLHLRNMISASIGVAEHAPDKPTNLSIEQEKSDLLRRADAAMYRAKSLGKNKVVISRAGEEFVVST